MQFYANLACERISCEGQNNFIKMNKLLIVLLAVCLVSTHAFVKRDAPAEGANYLETLQKQLEDASKNVGDQLKETFDPEKMKKGFNDIITNMEKALADLKKKANETPAA